MEQYLNKDTFYGNINLGDRKYYSSNDDSWVELVDYVGNDYRIVQAARVSYGKDDRSKGYEKDLELLKKLMEDGHLGPFEHVAATFRVYVPLFVARQWMRHRTQSFNEISRRYTKSNIEFWFPSEDRVSSKEMRRLIEDTYSIALKSYKALLENGIPKEVARTVLPIGMYTKFYATANLRNWLHFLDLRTDSHAQFEIREMAFGIDYLLSMVFPHTMVLWRESKTRGYW